MYIYIFLCQYWCRDPIESLIDSFKDEPCLYATDSRGYHNKHLREEALERIRKKVVSYDRLHNLVRLLNLFCFRRASQINKKAIIAACLHLIISTIAILSNRALQNQ